MAETLMPVVQLISLFFALKILRNRRKQLYRSQSLRRSPNLLARIFGDLSGIDSACRVIQFLLIFIGGMYQQNARFVTTHTRLVMVSSARKLDKVSNFFGIVRKVTRYPRTIDLLKDSLQQVKRYPKQSKNWVVKLDALFGILGNLLNILFFFADHYMGLFIIGIFTQKKHLQIADYWGTVVWFWSSLFLLFKDLTMYYLYQKNYYHQNSNKKQFLRYLIIDVIRNILDTISNIAFFYDGAFSKSSVGLMGVVSGVLWLTDFASY